MATTKIDLKIENCFVIVDDEDYTAQWIEQYLWSAAAMRFIGSDAALGLPKSVNSKIELDVRREHAALPTQKLCVWPNAMVSECPLPKRALLLLVSQRHYRIDSSGATRGDVAR